MTLLFSAEQYEAAAEAYLRGVERRIQAGKNPAVASVASLFVSRWDKAVAGRVPEELRDRLGIAVAKQAYRAYRELLDSPRWGRLANARARGRSGCCGPPPRSRIGMQPAPAHCALCHRPSLVKHTFEALSSALAEKATCCPVVCHGPGPRRRSPQGISRTTSAGSLSRRRPWNRGWRNSPSAVHSVKPTWATSRGLTQCTPDLGRPRRVEGRPVLLQAASVACRLVSVRRLKPVPTLPA